MLVEHLLREDRGVVRVTGVTSLVVERNEAGTDAAGDTYSMGMHTLCHGHWCRLGIDLPPVIECES
jgi:hypothetical protein